MKQNIVLSICIASFNHGDSLLRKINELLNNDNSEFEIVVSDNCSTDNTIELLEKITDDRFKLIRNRTNNGATSNYMRALSGGTGKYSMFMTDKDSLHHENLDVVIKNLKVMEFSFGYFSLDYSGTDYTVEVVNDLQSCFERFAYLSKHPTGYIFKTDLLRHLDINVRFCSPEVVGCFPFEFLCAELCQNLGCVLLNIPFCVTSKLILGNQSETSMSYSENARNLFFSPYYRFEMFEKYIRHLNGLKLRRKIRLKIILLLLRRAHHEAVFGYIDIIKSKPHRIHYKINDNAVKNYNELLTKRNFFRSLRTTDAFLNNLEKTYVLSKFIINY
jgi:glycosyltransferase involved in cell wall biosynthesis